jgi:hypothetical protein
MIVDMCLQCDGYSFEDVMRMTDLHIRVYGYSLVQVEEAEPWCYTIGLTESFGHPELVACGLKMEAEVELIRTVAGMVIHDRLDDGRLAALDMRLVTVHHTNLTGDMFGTWMNFYGDELEPGSFMQVLPPRSWLCECHRDAVVRLDRPPATRRTR